MISQLRGSVFLLLLGIQAGAQKPSFEVSSIKKSAQPYNTLRMTGDRFFGQGWTLIDLLKFAYATCDEFLLGSLLADRFQLKAHLETRDLPV